MNILEQYKRQLDKEEKDWKHNKKIIYKSYKKFCKYEYKQKLKWCKGELWN